MGVQLAPPTWEDVGHLLRFGAYLYMLLAVLAASCSVVYRSRYLRTTLVSEGAPLQQSLSYLLRSSRIDEFVATYAVEMAVVRMFLSAIICVMYVVSTYTGQVGLVHLVLFKLLGMIFFLQLVVKMFMSPRPLSYVLHAETILEAISLASLIKLQASNWLNFSFLQAYIILSRYFQLGLTLEILFMRKSSAVQRQLTQLTLEFIVFIYVFACGLMLFERMGDPWQTLTATTFELTLANSFYFTVVTIFTVGYGDFVPYTLMGRLWIIFIIVFGAYLVSRKIGQVIDVVSGMRRGLGSFVKGEGVDHCVICGNVKWEYLKSFVQEFYGDARNEKKKLLVMCDQPNWSEDTWNQFVTTHPTFRNNVVYLEGSCVSRDDLVRAHVDDAKAVFILNNQHNNDPYAEDSETLKRILTIRSYAPNLPIYSMCALRDSMLQITFALEHLTEVEAKESKSRRGSVMSGMTNLLHPEMRQNNSNLLSGSGFPGDRADTHPSAYYGDFPDEDDEDGMFVPNYDGTSEMKSEAVCMQEVETSVLAENVFCNGLSTLLANLILRVHPKTKPTDPSWAIEYKIGTECRFEYVKLPMRLHERKFSEIATIMYDYGVLLVATKRFFDKKWKPITPDTTLHISSIGLIITFHSIHYVDSIMKFIAECVAYQFKDEEDDGTDSQDVPSVDDELSDHNAEARYRIAGHRLTGDAPVGFDYSEDEFDAPGNSHERLGRSRSGHRTFLESSGEFDTGPQRPQIAPRLLPEPSVTGSLPDASAQTRASNVPSASRVAALESQIAWLRSDGDSGKQEAGPSTTPTCSESPSLFEDSEFTKEEKSTRAATDDRGRNPAASDSMITDGTGAIRTDTAFAASSNIQSSVDFVTEDGDLSPPADLRSESARVGSASPSKSALAEDTLTRRNYKPTQHVSFPNQKAKKNTIVAEKKKKHGKNGKNSKSSLVKAAESSGNDDNPFMFFGDDELPTELKGHIIVCTIGHMAMQNLKHFLHRVWVPRGPDTKDIPVVAICPRLSEDEEAEYSGYASEKLFIIQGNSLSVKTLRRAQYVKAKAIVILACEDKNDVDHMDAKAIFTVMTLDHLLREDSPVFVCSMLDAEESMQLLRAPAKARRRTLGMYRNSSIFDSGADDSEGRKDMDEFSRHLSSKYSRGDSRQSFGEYTRSIGNYSSAIELPRSMSFFGLRSNTYTDRRAFLQRRVGIRDQDDHGFFKGRSAAHYGSIGNFLGGEEDMLNFPSHGGESALNFLGRQRPFTDRRPGIGSTSTRARDESFEKQRYASGEMMISSTYMSLLIREYSMPGLMEVVQKLFGAGMGKHTRSKRGWVRSISVPSKWVMAGKDGRRMYRELFETLLGLGAVPLGLYRSGEAAVRVQLHVDSDARDGGASSLAGPADPNTSSTAALSASGYVSPVVSNGGDNVIELGGDAVHRRRDSFSFERGSILQNLPDYGAIRLNRSGSDKSQSRSIPSDVDDVRSGEQLNLNIPGSMVFQMAEDMQAARPTGDENEVQSYTCPSSGRTAIFKELPGNENVLPYVYTNPEAYTLVSENDAVYVLVAPNAQLPRDWS